MTKPANSALAALTRFEHLTRIHDAAVDFAITHDHASAMPVANHAARERDNLTIAEAATDLETYWQQEYQRAQ